MTLYSLGVVTACDVVQSGCGDCDFVQSGCGDCDFVLVWVW